MEVEQKDYTMSDNTGDSSTSYTVKDPTVPMLSSVDENKLNILGTLVPARVIRHHIRHKNTEPKFDENEVESDASELVAFTEEYKAAVLFADISGFSALAEKLVADLGCAANAAEKLSTSVGKSLEKMVASICDKGGDVIKFAGDAILAVFPAKSFNGNLEQAVLCCTQVAISLLSLELKAGGDVKLSVHCGMGAGNVIAYHVGGLKNRWEYVITGNPVDQIGSAEPEADAGEVVMSKESYAIIKRSCQGKLLESGNFRVESLVGVKEFPPKSQIASDFKQIANDPSELKRMCALMMCYVPRPVLLAIESGQSLWIAELRICSTLFCRLIGLQFKSKNDLDAIQRAVYCVQEQIYTYEGTLCRFIVDDKGSGLLLAFGLPPYMHENDPVRATKSALDIHANIKKLSDKSKGLNLSCSIGVTSGRVFCGTAGGQIRCEYTLHGTLVNLAARYMVAAKDGVLCGEQTYNESRHHVIFDPPTLIKVKGKESLVAVYRPRSKRLLSLAFKAETEMVGREHEMKIIESTMQKLDSQDRYKGVIAIEGEAGLGKSRLCQEIMEKGAENSYQIIYGVGTDTEVNTPFFLWKSMLTQLYQAEVCFGDDVEATELINKMNDEEKLGVLESMIICPDEDSDSSHLVGLYPLLAPILPEIVKVENTNTTEKMKGAVRANNLTNLIVTIIKNRIERLYSQAEASLNEVVQNDKLKRIFGDREALLETHARLPTRFIMMIEDLQWVDAKSLDVVQQLMKECDRILLVVSARDSIHQNQQSYNSDFYRHILNIPETRLLLLKPLDLEQVRKCMCNWLKVKRVPDKAAAAVFEKSGGHPLFSEELCKLMKESGALIIEDGEGKLSKESQGGNFGLPDTISALMTSRLDRVLPSQQLTLKVAAVIGMMFLKHELAAVMPMKNTPVEARKELDNDVDALVKQGFLIEDDGPVSHYRFKNAMLRESAYSLLLFKKRKELHSRLAIYYEERNKEYLEPWYLLLANNYFHAEKFKKAVYFLEKAGNDALDLHGMEQVWSCFTRLLNMQPQNIADIPLARKAGWYRKVGEALLYLGKPLDAEENFHDALRLMKLDCTEIPQPRGFLCFAPTEQPRLVRELPMFKTYTDQGAYDVLIEAARCYELLGTLDRNRESPVALERRLNAIYLAETTKAFEKPSTELARSYASIAEFYAGMGRPKNIADATMFSKKANQIIDRVEDSETQAFVHKKIGEYHAMIGELKQAESGIKKAAWVCRFLNFERMQQECQEFLILIAMFGGERNKCHQLAKGLVNVQVPSIEALTLAARCAVLVGEFRIAKEYIEKATHQAKGSFNHNYVDLNLWTALGDTSDGYSVFSILVARTQNNLVIALSALQHAILSLEKIDFSSLPLAKFHSLVMIFYALTEIYRLVGSKDSVQNHNTDIVAGGFLLFHSPGNKMMSMKDRNSKVQPTEFSVNHSKKHVIQQVKLVFALLTKYCKAYKPCKPYLYYCEALMKLLYNKKLDVNRINNCVAESDKCEIPLIKGLALLLHAQNEILQGKPNGISTLEVAKSLLKQGTAKLELDGLGRD